MLHVSLFDPFIDLEVSLLTAALLAASHHPYRCLSFRVEPQLSTVSLFLPVVCTLCTTGAEITLSAVTQDVTGSKFSSQTPDVDEFIKVDLKSHHSDIWGQQPPRAGLGEAQL